MMSPRSVAKPGRLAAYFVVLVRVIVGELHCLVAGQASHQFVAADFARQPGSLRAEGREAFSRRVAEATSVIGYRDRHNR